MNPLLTSFVLLGTCVAQLHATVIWHADQNIEIPSSVNGVSLNIATGFTTTAPDPDFIATDINFFFDGIGILTGSRLLPARSAAGPTDPIILATSGIQIDESLIYGPPGFGASQEHVGPGPGQFPPGESGFIAFKFDPADAGNYAYGWMRVTLGSGTGMDTIHEWAYSDTPGEAVFVGIVPEPHTLLLAGLGLLVIAGRRR